jgi:hypothetical protein
LIEEEKRRLKE